MTKARISGRQLGLRFDVPLKEWYDWTEKESDTMALTVPSCTFTILRGDGSKLYEVTVTSSSQMRRYAGTVRGASSAYYIRTVVLERGDSVRLGGVTVTFKNGICSLSVEHYRGPGHYEIVQLDGGGYDVKERSTRLK